MTADDANMARRNEMRPKLTFEKADAICREFLPIGEQIFSFMARLSEVRFEAFRPRGEFIESFAASEQEVEMHRLCLIEEAKEWLGRPAYMRMSDEEVKRIYVSPLLQRLREERDEANGVSVRELSGRYSVSESIWRREINPCRRRMVQFEMSQRERYRDKFEAMLKDERSTLKRESQFHATGLSKSYTFDSKGRFDFFSATMERNAAKIGFSYDKTMSRADFPVFSKSVHSDWRLCWAIEDRSEFIPSPFEGIFYPRLELRSRALRGPLSNSWGSGECLLIRYGAIIPGFSNGYGRFVNLCEVETAIKAHLYLYGLIAPVVERALHKVLA